MLSLHEIFLRLWRRVIISGETNLLMAKVNIVDIDAQARAMTGQELREWGLSKIAYLRTITHDGVALIAIHAADGTPMAVAEDEASAVEVILEQEMIPAFLQ